MNTYDERPHTVYRYTDNIYKVIQFYSDRCVSLHDPERETKHYDTKLDSSLSRARKTVLELALCNEWDYFCTFTLDSGFDRFDLSSWFKRFMQWLRDYRKKGFDIGYLLIPEKHDDGSWHAHGFLSGIPSSCLISFRDMHSNGYRTESGKSLPWHLINSDYLNWPDYQEKFGFCSLGKIKDPVAAGFYATKYITKDTSRLVDSVGSHIYYASRGLNRATKHIDFYGRSPAIDRLLVNQYDFCATGMTHVRDGADWSFCFEYADFDDLEQLNLSGESEADSFYEYEQLSLNLKTMHPF